MSTMTQTEDVETWSGKDRGDENFPVGSWLIERRFRKPMHCFYAFARNADDIADSPVLSPEDKIRRLDIMEEVLLGHRDVGSRSALALRHSLAETRVRAIHAQELLVAFRRDATQLRYESIDDLYDYCRYSAVPVGRYVLDLHGERHECYSPSDALCMSLQILNHIQDSAKDLKALNRCYLPLALMRHFNCSVEDLLRPAESRGIRRVFDTLLDRINRLNLAASELPEIAVNMRLRLECAVILGLALRLTARLSQHDPIAKRVKLTRTDALMSVMLSVFKL
ncbi:MAG: squalene/phytoene synthase family protein [Acetobacteraceae bacterium]|nr:squalene/phytoene synthase family protein [Pseudomonadota bacterium]